MWLLDLPHDDDSLEFWCLCYVFDGGSYQKLSSDDIEYYNLFKELYDTYVKCLPWNMQHTITGQMITSIRKTSQEDYENVVVTMVNNIKKVYGVE